MNIENAAFMIQLLLLVVYVGLAGKITNSIVGALRIKRYVFIVSLLLFIIIVLLLVMVTPPLLRFLIGLSPQIHTCKPLRIGVVAKSGAI